MFEAVTDTYIRFLLESIPVQYCMSSNMESLIETVIKTFR